MRTFNSLPNGYLTWVQYVRNHAVIVNPHPQKNAMYQAMYEDHMNELYSDIGIENPAGLLVRYRLPMAAREKYGNYLFRIFNTNTGTRRLVRFHMFDEWGLDKMKGTCEYKDAYPFKPNRMELNKIMEEGSRGFWMEAGRISREWQPYKPVYFVNNEDNKQRHSYYLGSKQWHDIRNQVCNRDQNICQSCYSFVKNPEVHHKTYERWGEERLSDLITLCRSCHAWLHGKGMFV